MKKLIQATLIVTLTLEIIFIVTKTVSWSDAKAAIHPLQWHSLLFILGFIVLISLLKALRFFFTLRFGNINVSWKKCIQVFFASQTFSPLPAGEVARAMLFKEELKIPLHELAAPVLLQALMELWTATIWVTLIALFTANLLGVWLIGLIGLLLILSIPLLFPKALFFVIQKLKSKGVKTSWLDKTKTTFTNFEIYISAKGKNQVWKFWLIVIALGLMGHAVGGGLLWYIAYLEGAKLTWSESIFSGAMAALIQGILTVIPGGLGVTEGGLVGIFSSFGLSWHKSLIVTLLYRLATLPLAILISFIFLLITQRKKILQFTHITTS